MYTIFLSLIRQSNSPLLDQEKWFGAVIFASDNKLILQF